MLRRTRITIGVALGALALILAGCGNSADQTSQATSATSATGSVAESHNQADVMFAQHMIPHHQQAIQMSDILLAKQGIDPRVVDLAEQIKAAQGPEIEQMQGWLAEWGQPTMPMMPMMPPNSMPGKSPMPSTPSSGMPMPGMPGMPGMDHMSGMMFEQDIAALKSAQGVDAAKLFLTQMIAHHQGAIGMAQKEIDTGQYSPAVSLARSIVTSQQEEITTMQNILKSL